MRFPAVRIAGRDGTVSGFRPQDQHLVDQQTDHVPRIQGFMTQEEDPNPIRYCGNCETRLERISPTKFLCLDCRSVINSEIDKPLENISQEMYVPSAHYHTNINNWQDDTTIPFFASWSPDHEAEKQDCAYEITYSSADGRIQHRKVTDVSRLAEAISS